MLSPFSTPIRLMHASFLYTGLGVMLLASLLHVFSAHWGLNDAQSGVLLGAQFAGLFVGAYLMSANLHATLQRGLGIAAAGSLLLTLAYVRVYVPALFAYHLATAAFFVFGTGLGLITTVANVIVGLSTSVTQLRSTRLSLLNVSWSVGAFLSPILAGLFVGRGHAGWLLPLFPAAALLLLAYTRMRMRPLLHQPSGDAGTFGSHLLPLLYFAAVFFLYGGVEITISGWLGTYGERYASLDVAAAAYAGSALWLAFAVGRLLAAGGVRIASERTLRLTGVLMAAGAGVLLQNSHGPRMVELCAALIGIGLGPFFPLTFSRMMALRPTPRQAGAASSVTGLGQALIPYLVGLLSMQAASLRLAMWVPVGLALLLSAATLLNDRRLHARF
jgi:fucose permease